MLRREYLAHLLCATAGVAAPSLAWAKPAPWPNKPVKWVIGLAAGGLADVLARSVQPKVVEALSKPLVIENKGGAGGNVAASEVAGLRKQEDHIFLVVPTTTVSVNPGLFRKLPFDAQNDLTPVGLLANSQLFLFVRRSLGVKTLEDFVALAKSRPEGLNYGSAGLGTTTHLAAELMKKATGLEATHVPYRGVAPAFQDLVAGQIDFAFGPATAMQWVNNDGPLDILAVASAERAKALAQVRTFEEAGIAGVLADSLFGIFAPKSTPPQVVAEMNAKLNSVLAQPDIQKFFMEAGAEALPLASEAFAHMVHKERRVFMEVVTALDLKAD